MSVIVVFNKLVVAPNLIAVYKPKNFNDIFGLCSCHTKCIKIYGFKLELEALGICSTSEG
jgi:hypothetical protein